MLRAITRDVSHTIENCELGFIERQQIDFARAVRQLESYRDALRRCAVEVACLPEDLSYPDACFVEDTAIVLDEVAIICSPGALSRRGEIQRIAGELAKHRELTHIESPATMDGGDVLVAGKRILVGRSRRTNSDGIRMLARIVEPFDYTVTAANVTGCLHFKSACTAINDETLLVNPEWVDQAELVGFRLVNVPREEPWSANVLRVKDTVLVQADFPRTLERIREVHSSVETLDVSEFRKAEASLTCLSLIFKDHQGLH